MNVLVFGAGALGSLFGGLLATKHHVTLVGRKRHVEAIRRHGLQITGRSEVISRPEAVEDVGEASFPQLVLLATKTHDTASALEALRPFWRTATFVSFQSGLEKEELLALRAKKVLAGVTYQRATLLAPGRVFQAADGETLLGPYQAISGQEASSVASAFREAGIPADAVEDMKSELWLATLVSACINPLTALLRIPSGKLCTLHSLREAMRGILEEGLRVAAARGVKLDAEDALKRVCGVAEAAGERKSEMLYDLERGRRTEVDALNGALVEMGRRRGIDCPINRLVTLLVKAAARREPE